MKTRQLGKGDRNGDAGRASAETLAIAALNFLAAEPERLGHFMALCGIGPDELRAAATEPNFLAGVLDHIGSDDSLLIAFASQENLKPEAVMRAASALGGGVWERDTP